MGRYSIISNMGASHRIRSFWLSLQILSLNLMILASIWWTVCFSLCFFCKVAAWKKLIQSIATVSQSLYEQGKQLGYTFPNSPNNCTVVKIPIQWWYVWFIHMGSTNPMYPGFDFEAGNRDCCSGHQRGAAEGFKKAPKKMPLRLKTPHTGLTCGFSIQVYLQVFHHSICFFSISSYMAPFIRCHVTSLIGAIGQRRQFLWTSATELPSVLIPGERCVLGWSMGCTAQRKCATTHGLHYMHLNYLMLTIATCVMIRKKKRV